MTDWIGTATRGRNKQARNSPNGSKKTEAAVGREGPHGIVDTKCTDTTASCACNTHTTTHQLCEMRSAHLPRSLSTFEASESSASVASPGFSDGSTKSNPEQISPAALNL